MVKIKICGITNMADAAAAVRAGADALGFVFAESPRRISPDAAAEIVSTLPPFITTVGVFAGESADSICRIMDAAGLDAVQLHGYEGEFAWPHEPRWRIIRGIRVRREEDIRAAAELKCSALLLDTHVEGALGGTGRTFNWNLAILAKETKKPVILAGGLSPENAGEAVRKVHPYAVDVSSGVEASPGIKDHRKIEEFIKNVRES
ncbi:MAG: phosphoribosylanthranilate isomerase [Armatimonadota bacterium]|jgi:phosphoribosylanthranilate isomerase